MKSKVATVIVTLLILAVFMDVSLIIVTALPREQQEVIDNTPSKLASIQNDLQDILGKCDNIISLMNNTELVTRVEELTRENEVLRQEVESQAHQLQLYDGMFKK